MTIPDFYIKRHDLQPYYRAQVLDANGDPVDITGATIRCTMKNLETSSLHINRITSGSNITSGTNGDFQWEWCNSDTLISGKHSIEFEITPTAGGKFTVPARPDEKALVFILDDIDNV